MAEILVGSVGVKLVPNAEGFTTKARSLLRGIEVDVGLNVDEAVARAELEDLTRPRTATVNADADTTAAEAKLDALARDRHVSLGVGGLAGATAGMSALLSGAIALSPALIPVVAVIGGLAAALSAPLVAVGGGLTIFGFIAGKAISDTEKVKKQIDDLKQKASTLVDPAARAAALAQAKTLEQSLTGPQKAFLSAQDSLKGAFSGLVTKAGPAIFGPVVTFMDLAAKTLPHVAPLLITVADALTQVLHSLDNSGALDSFIGFLTAMAGPAIVTGAKIMGNLAEGVGGLVAAAMPLGTSLGDGLVGLSQSFANFGQNAGHNGFQDFLDFVRENGPKVASTVGDIVKAAVDMGKALAPLGVVLLVLIDAFAKIIDNTPGPVLAILAGVLVGLIAGLNPIPALIFGIAAGMVYAYKHSDAFRKIIDSLWHDFLVPFGHFLAGPFLGFLKVLGIGFLTQASVAITAFRGLLTVALGVLSAILHGADAAFGWIPGIGPRIHAAAGSFDSFKDAVLGNLDRVNGKIQDTINKLAGIHSPPPVNVDVNVRYHGVKALRHGIGLDGGGDNTAQDWSDLMGVGGGSGGGGSGSGGGSGGGGGGTRNPTPTRKPSGSTRPGAKDRATLRRTQRAQEAAMERGTAKGARAGISDRSVLVSARRRA